MANFVVCLRNTKVAQYFAAGVSCVRLCDRHVAFLYVWETVVRSCMVRLRFCCVP